MTSAQAVTESRSTEHEDDEVSDATATRHDAALASVQRLLKARGVRSYVVHTIVLRLFGDGRPYALGQRRRHAPELAVHGNAGWMVATVTMGPRSGCYLISAGNNTDLQTVREPQQVVDLILLAYSQAT
ncbi:hypothetical protein [Streptosporangium subroseum]|uniref:hypothetical protein n=1 Tax=Streptosporangium subroseum TaxID=106412 RepID=UPI0030937131|nr:hypothetical protein OHB15_07340 [Streptosporangium subroseum]